MSAGPGSSECGHESLAAESRERLDRMKRKNGMLLVLEVFSTARYREEIWGIHHILSLRYGRPDTNSRNVSGGTSIDKVST
jgi:hypothetical protein